MPTVRLHRDDTIAVLTLDNPGKKNAMSDAMWEAVPQLMAGIDEDPQVTATVLVGAGDAFCSGADIAGLMDPDHVEGPIAAELALAASPKPVIAAIEGPCFGGGVQLAVACDVRIASRQATFSVPPAKLGLVYPWTATQKMVRLMGPAATKEMIFTAARWDAGRALSAGLVNQVVEQGAALREALAMAKTMAALSQLTIQASKELIDACAAGTIDPGVATDWTAAAVMGPDLPEGITAFRERRPARFVWRR